MLNTQSSPLRWSWCGAFVVLAFLFAGQARAEPLYMGEVSSASALYTVNQSTGMSTAVGNMGLVNGSFGGLTAGVSDGFLYGVHSPNEGINSSSAFLVKIDPATGAATPFASFSESTLGFLNPFATAVAISPTDPNVAIVAGFQAGNFSAPGFGDPYLWKVDVSTGAVLGAAVATADSLNSLTFSLDGTKLYGTILSIPGPGTAEFILVDVTSGGFTLVGSIAPAVYVEGLAFRPSDGVLFAINAFSSDELITINPATGGLLSTIGPLGIVGPVGLAFRAEPVPEPFSLFLVGAGLVLMISKRRRDRLSSRTAR